MQNQTNTQLTDIADELVKALISEGFIIQRYDAYTSNSIYLKLDYGVCNSIRISDHKGKGHLKYRYNIGPHITEFKSVKDKYPRFYYRADKVKNLVKKIISDKDAKMTRYGNRYIDFMTANKRDKNNNKGFWRQAYLVKL